MAKNKDKTLVEILHELTQKDRVVTFSNDFSGMLTVAVDEDHTHLGYPHGPLDELQRSVITYLGGFLGEE